MTGGNEVAADQLHVRPLDQLTSETLVAEGPVASPFFSPDGQAVGFYDRSTMPRQLKRVSILGGPTSTICELPPGDLRGASWGDDGSIFFAAGSGSGVWRVPAVGGQPEQLTTPDAEHGETSHWFPHVLPGSDAVLFTILGEEPEIALLSLDTSEYKVVVSGGSYAQYSATGHLVYAVEGNLWAVGFDLSTGDTVGAPVPVQEGVLTKPLGTANFGLSNDGSLIYVPGGAEWTGQTRTLVWVDREGREERLAAPPRLYFQPDVSPDGRRIAMIQAGDIWVYDVDRNTLTRLTFEEGLEAMPRWHPDGGRIAYAAARDGGSFDLFWRPADGTGAEERLATSENVQFPTSWSGDGQRLLFYGCEADFACDLWVLFPGASEPEPQRVLQTEFGEAHASVSPDGRWIAYQSNASGENEVYVRSFPDVEAGRWQVSSGGGSQPVWTPSGQELFYRGARHFMAVPVETEPTFSVGSPTPMFELQDFLFDVGRGHALAADGNQILLVKAGTGDDNSLPSEIVVVLSCRKS